MNIENLWSHVWNLKVQIVPVLVALLVAEVPNVIRRRAGLPYTPIYFSVFPLRELNPDLAVYLGDDWWYGGSSEKGSQRLRRKILVWSIVSLTISAILIPIIVGFSGAFFLTRQTLAQFLIVFVAYKSVGIVRAIREFPTHAVGTRRNKILLTVIYVAYLGVAVQIVTETYAWTTPFVNTGDWGGLAAGVGHLVFSEVIVQYLFLAVLVALFVGYLTEREPTALPDGDNEDEEYTCRS